MNTISTADLRRKEIINLCDGARLGCASDFEFDVCSGSITALIVRTDDGFLGLCQGDTLCIPWSRIECIGEDIVLVRYQSDELKDFFKKRKKKLFKND